MRHIDFTHKGQRNSNQDVILIKEIHPETYLYLIADGMGGYSDGELAAKIVTENIETYLSSLKIIDKKEIQIAVNKANLAIKQQKQQSHNEMGATVGGVIVNKGCAYCFWIGDVKILRFRKNKLFFESEDHSLLNQLKTNGSITDASTLSKYKHIVTKSIQGKKENSSIGFEIFGQIDADDIIIICSDGVHDIIDANSIEFMLNQALNIDLAIKKIKKRIEIEAIDNSSLIAITN